MIPKILHYIWVGPKKLDETSFRRIEAWRHIMPDFDIRFWGNGHLNFSIPYIREAFSVGAWNRISDYMRFAILIEHGGIYLDTDIEARRSLAPLLDCACFLGHQGKGEPNELINGAVIGAEKNHWFMREQKAYFDMNLRGHVDCGAFSGPGLLTQQLGKLGRLEERPVPYQIKDITIFPPRFFYPYGWKEAFSESCVTPDTYLIHLWDHSWGQKRFLKKVHSKIRNWLMQLFVSLIPATALTRAKKKYGLKDLE